MAVVRYVGASGPATIPMAGPAPEARTPGGDGATPGEAARPGRGANPQPCRSPTTVTEPGPVTRWHTFRGDRCHDRTKMAPVAATCRHCHVTLDPKQARDHPSSYSLACARCTIAWARRTYLLSARSRTVLTPSVFCRASASLLDRPKAVSGASTSSANFSGPDSASEGGVVSDLSAKVSRWWLGVRPARARQGRRLEAGHCWGARPWSRVVTRSVVSPGPARGRLHCRR
jgi:hypothetical protein